MHRKDTCIFINCLCKMFLQIILLTQFLDVKAFLPENVQENIIPCDFLKIYKVN